MKQEIPNLEPVLESPVVDLSEFIQKTVKTRSMLQDFSVLLKPDALWETLSDWMLSLNGIMKKLNTQRYMKLLQSKHSEKCNKRSIKKMDKDFDENLQTDEQTRPQNAEEEESEQEKNINVLETENERTLNPLIELSIIEEHSVQNLCNVEDPFPLPVDLLPSVKDLTRQCFNSLCFRSIISSLEPDLGAIAFCDICPDCFQNNETSVSTVLNLSDNEDESKAGVHDTSDNDGISFTVSLSNNIESAISHQNLCDNSECNGDFAKFIRCYFFLLDENDFIENVYSRGKTLTEHEKSEIWTAWIQCLRGE